MTTSAMPSEIPPCGRIGCNYGERKHTHDDWQPGDRVVIEPKLATAPGFAYGNPRGTITERRHFRVTAELVTVELDAGGGSVEVDWHLLTRVRTFDQRHRRPRAERAPRARKHALDSGRYDEPTLGDYLTDELASS